MYTLALNHIYINNIYTLAPNLIIGNQKWVTALQAKDLLPYLQG